MDSSIIGRYLSSIKITTTDAVQSLPDSCKFDSNGVYYVALYITVDSNDVRIRYVDNPTQGDGALGHKIVKDTSYRVVGTENISNFKFISAANGSAGILQVTPEY